MQYSVRWCFINHHLILFQKTIRQKVLEIPHATLKDNELYICLATNDAGQSQASTALSVTGGKQHEIRGQSQASTALSVTGCKQHDIRV